MSVAHALVERQWYRRGALSFLLWPASTVFRLLVGVRRTLYRRGVLHCVPAGVPVVIVGNITAGGSGKTPVVLAVCELLRARGRSPGIVSRGYGARILAPRGVHVDSDPADVGDEPVLLARRARVPVWVGARRPETCAALRAAHPEVDVLVLDDGLQHYRLCRDVELAVVDHRGVGNGFLLPAGPLREPLRRLCEVDALLLNGMDAERLPRRADLAPCFDTRLSGEVLRNLGDTDELIPARAFAGQMVHAVAGIGDPERFFASLRTLGMQPITHPYPDHHRFAARDIRFDDDLPVVMTEKDAVKCARFATRQHWVLPVHASLDVSFADWLLARLERDHDRSTSA